MTTETKKCRKCEKSKPVDAEHFYRNRKTKDGFATTCKACDGARYAAKRRQQLEHGRYANGRGWDI